MPLAVKVRQARLSALLSDGDELLPYVLARSCSDPRDRILDRDEMFQLRVLEGGVDVPRVAEVRRTVPCTSQCRRGRIAWRRCWRA